MSVISTYNLSKSYKETLAIKSVNMTLEKGDIYGLIGKNGAGKTTLMRIICGLTFPSAGSYSLFGAVTENDITQNRVKLSAIIEAPALYKNFNAKKNLQIIALLKGIEINSPQLDQLLAFSGLENVGNKKVKNFSLGMKQRLAIAMALLGDPEVLILDEPVNGLDPVGIVEIRDILKRLNKEMGVTILISSHILSELSQLATKYGIIDKGCLIEEISAQDLEQKMKKTLNITLALKTDFDRAAVVLKDTFDITDFIIEGDTIVFNDNQISEKASEINMALAKENIMIKGINITTMDLEQYFIDSTREAKK